MTSMYVTFAINFFDSDDEPIKYYCTFDKKLKTALKDFCNNKLVSSLSFDLFKHDNILNRELSIKDNGLRNGDLIQLKHKPEPTVVAPVKLEDESVCVMYTYNNKKLFLRQKKILPIYISLKILCDKHHLAITDVFLSYNGKVVDANKTFSDYNIKTGCKLTVYHKLS